MHLNSSQKEDTQPVHQVEKPDVESHDHSLPDDQPIQQISVVRQGGGHHLP